LIEHEQRWLPQLAPILPLPTPVPVRFGEPQGNYPWGWSICHWIEGADALVAPPADAQEAAQCLAGFLAAMHVEAPRNAPVNHYRGVALGAREESFLAAVPQVGGLLETRALLDSWESTMEAPAWDGPDLWVHGDMHPLNLVVRDGHIAGVIDFGDLTSGDPASDLVVPWLLWPHDGRARETFRSSLPYKDADWQRARGWALALGTVIVANSADRPTFQARARDAALAAMRGL
jgi:aminoglycoside phosphotransferase (APT) family kinase protein